MVTRTEMLLLSVNTVILLVLCILFGVRTWKAYAWVKALPDLDEDQVWCSREGITEGMVMSRFGTPNWTGQQIPEGMLYERLGIHEWQVESDEGLKHALHLKRALYLFQPIGGLYGVLVFAFTHDGTCSDFTYTFSKDSREVVSAFRECLQREGARQ